MQACREHIPVPGPHPSAVPSATGPFRRGSLQVTANPRGIHPIGGRNGDPMEAQRSGFHWERTSDGMSEPCPLGRGEGYEVREDEVGRFKGMGYLGEGGNRNPPSPRQLFGNFLSAQKMGPSPEPSEAGPVGRGGARERRDGYPFLGVRNTADFATTTPGGETSFYGSFNNMNRRAGLGPAPTSEHTLKNRKPRPQNDGSRGFIVYS